MFTTGEPAMKKLLPSLAVIAALAAAGSARATTSTVFWTPATNYVQPFGIPHLTYDTYFRNGVPGTSNYPIFTGLTVGVLPMEKLQAEVGFDLVVPLGAGTNPFQLNAKLGAPEGSLFANSPGLSGGIYGIGFESGVTDPNVLHAELGKTFPVIGNLTVGGYYSVGSKAALGVFPDGSDPDRAGFMASWTSVDWKLELPGLYKIVGLADVQTGKNNLGAVGAGLGFYFTPAIDLLAGPVFFFEDAVQPGGSDWMWSFQIDVDFDLMKKKAPKE
jgi:hypothetical protein